MIKYPPPPAKIAARFFCALSEFYASNPDSTPQLDSLMAWIYERNSEGGQVCSTDIVRERRFGTLPTVTSNLNLLTTRGLLRAVVADDRRVKWLKLTKAGEAVLEQRANLIAAAVAGS